MVDDWLAGLVYYYHYYYYYYYYYYHYYYYHYYRNDREKRVLSSVALEKRSLALRLSICFLPSISVSLVVVVVMTSSFVVVVRRRSRSKRGAKGVMRRSEWNKRAEWQF